MYFVSGHTLLSRMEPPPSGEDYPSTSPTKRRSRPTRTASKPDPSSAFLPGSSWVPPPAPPEDYVEVSSSAEPRSFPYSVKQLCWEKAEVVKGRDPTRWRRDPLGNLLFRKLAGCAGCLCHDFDHIVPYSKGGKSTLDNCQVLQASANRSKGNRGELSKAELIQRSRYCRVSGRNMDMIELSAYGDIRHTQESGGCFIQ